MAASKYQFPNHNMFNTGSSGSTGSVGSTGSSGNTYISPGVHTLSSVHDDEEREDSELVIIEKAYWAELTSQMIAKGIVFKMLKENPPASVNTFIIMRVKNRLERDINSDQMMVHRTTVEELFRYEDAQNLEKMLNASCTVSDFGSCTYMMEERMLGMPKEACEQLARKLSIDVKNIRDTIEYKVRGKLLANKIGIL